MVVTSEVYLAKKFISPEEWLLFWQMISPPCFCTEELFLSFSGAGALPPLPLV